MLLFLFQFHPPTYRYSVIGVEDKNKISVGPYYMVFRGQALMNSGLGLSDTQYHTPTKRKPGFCYYVSSGATGKYTGFEICVKTIALRCRPCGSSDT